MRKGSFRIYGQKRLRAVAVGNAIRVLPLIMAASRKGTRWQRIATRYRRWY